MQNDIHLASSLGVTPSNYWQHYGLKGDPFNLAADMAPYFALQPWEENLDLVQHLCRYENMLICTLGPEGAGKTTFLQQSLAQIGDGLLISKIKAHSELTDNELLTRLTMDFGLEALRLHTFENLSEKIEVIITTLQKQGKIAAVFIDDAEKLPQSLLSILLEFIQEQANSEARVHILLFGEPSLKDKLATAVSVPLLEEFVHFISLAPLSKKQTRAFIESRLHFAGFNKPLPLTDKELEEIHNAAKGNPGQLNRLTAQKLFERLAEPIPIPSLKSTRPFKWPSPAIIFAVGLLGLGLWVAFQWRSSIVSGTPTVKETPSSSFPAKPPTIKEQQTSTDEDKLEELFKKAEEVAYKNRPAIEPSAHGLFSPAFEAPVPEKPVSKLPVQKDTKLEELAEKTLNFHSEAQPPWSTIEKARTGAKPADRSEFPYVIQLAAVTTVNEAQAFIKQSQLSSQATIFKVQNDKTTFYIVTVEHYGTIAQAQAAIKNLPSYLQELKPWIRSVKDLSLILPAPNKKIKN